MLNLQQTDLESFNQNASADVIIHIINNCSLHHQKAVIGNRHSSRGPWKIIALNLNSTRWRYSNLACDACPSSAFLDFFHVPRTRPDLSCYCLFQAKILEDVQHDFACFGAEKTIQKW